jgi:putative ABC transport system substrate-binding protein
MEMGSIHNYESAFKQALKAGSAAIAVTRHRLTQANTVRQQIIELAAKHRLSAIY